MERSVAGTMYPLSFFPLSDQQSMDAVSALVFDKSYRRKRLRIRVNHEFLCIKQFRPPLCFGASELSKTTIPKESLGYWWDVVSGVML